MSAEMHLTKTRSDLAKWQAMGDYEGMLLDVYKNYTDEWAKAFPRQAISLHLAKVLDLPPSFCERIIDYGLSRYPGRFTIQNCQLSGRKEDTGKMTYDLIQKYRDRAHHGFQSLAALARPNERMGSIEMAALNVVHAGGEYWELWHGDGFSVETSGAVLRILGGGKSLGYEAYKKKLISEGKYRRASMSAGTTTPITDQAARRLAASQVPRGGETEEAVIFLHLPKTAGTTVNRLIEWEYRLSEMYSIDPVLFKWSAAHLRKLPPGRLKKIRMFKGHMLFGLHEVLPQPATYITVLRDPVDRVISAFYFMRSYKLHPLYWKLRREKWTLGRICSQLSTRDNVQSKIVAGGGLSCSLYRREIVEKAKSAT